MEVEVEDEIAEKEKKKRKGKGTGCGYLKPYEEQRGSRSCAPCFKPCGKGYQAELVPSREE